MIPLTIENKLAKLPENLKLKAEVYIDELLDQVQKAGEGSGVESADRGYGSLKGKIWMSEDFNEPLEDFKDYM